MITKFAMKEFLMCFITLLIFQHVKAESQITLPEVWQLQPTKSLDTPPIEKEWATEKAVDWRRQRVSTKGVSWAKTKRPMFNNLWYQQEITLPPKWQNGYYFLDFRRIEGDAIIFWNGNKVGELLRPGGEIDVTKFVKPDEKNQLRVFMTRDYSGISRGFEQDLLRYTARNGRKLPPERCGFGITAPVKLIYCPKPAGIKDVFVKTSWREKKLSFIVDMLADKKLTGLTLKAVVYDEKNQSVLEVIKKNISVTPGKNVITLDKNWQNPITWELDRGYQYHAKIELIKNQQIADQSQDIKFGFREVWVKGNQIMMNGHPIRWRVEWNLFGLTKNSLPFLKQIGRNCIYFQGNPTSWWCDWSETPYYKDDLLDLLDKEGVAVLMPVPSICHIGTKLLEEDSALQDYKREMNLWIKRYRNHPSILAWSVGMNSFNPRDAIHPHNLGKKSNYRHVKAKIIEKAIEIAKEVDPTRLAYSHADGNLGDLASSNNYPNFTPLQEREEYPIEWAKSGNMPYLAAETSGPYGGCFFKGKLFLFTEYAAMYFGDKAYDSESRETLQNTMKYGLSNRGHGRPLKKALPHIPLYWDLSELFVKNMDRAWRTFGVQGWHYFNFGISYGFPPGRDPRYWQNRYAYLRKPVTERPEWANPYYDIYREAMQPLLVYIAGTPVHTDKTHAFFAGETIKKQIAAVWDGPEQIELDCNWTLNNKLGKELASGKNELKLNPGDIKFAPIEITAPQIQARTACTLTLQVMEKGQLIVEDTFAIELFPKPEKVVISAKVKVYDPQGKSSSWLKQTGLVFDEYKVGDSLENVDLLIIGREAIKGGFEIPYSEKELNSGLKVLILEQKPEMWEAMGLKTIETMPRYVFPVDLTNPIFKGLKNEDFINWRGNPDLLPERKAARGYDSQRAPKWTNRHAVASVVIQIPQTVGFTPLLAAEFDLDYTPLMQFNYGRGSIFFCSLDLTDRVGTSPAATILAHNLLETIAAKNTTTKTTLYSGNQNDLKLLEKLQVGLSGNANLTNPATSLVIQGNGKQAYSEKELKAFIAKGGTVITLPQNSKTLEKLGLTSIEKTLYKAPLPSNEPIFQTIGPRLMRWRDALNVTCIKIDKSFFGKSNSDGLFLLQKMGKGQRLFTQLSSQLLNDRYLDDDAKRENIQLSIARLNQLLSRILTNAGATPSKKLVDRITELQAGPAYETLGSWYTLGPFSTKDLTPKLAMKKVYSGEKNAILGDTNPNLYYKRADGKDLDFRTIVSADSSRFINLGKALNAYSKSLAYVTKTVKSPKDRTAILRLGVDYFMKVWVNGKIAYDLTKGHGAPQENRHRLKINLKEGENVITLKILSGSKGFGFWANLSKPGAKEQKQESKQKLKVDLYDPQLTIHDPYEYHYW